MTIFTNAGFCVTWVVCLVCLCRKNGQKISILHRFVTDGPFANLLSVYVVYT